MSDLAQPAAHAVYLAASRLTARVLGLSDLVQGVLVHRSVATGEVDFARSDIDLLLVVRQPASDPCDGPELASLLRRIQVLRRVNPALGHIEVHDAPGLRSWIQTDTYRGSMECRSSRAVYGAPLNLAAPRVRRADAVRRFAIWPDNFFSTAVRERDQRNLRKIAFEMWNAYATAKGIIEEPHLTRREAAAHWSATEDSGAVAELKRRPDDAPRHVFHLAERLHRELLPPLKRADRPIIFRVKLPPRYRDKTIVIIPHAGWPIPPEAFRPTSFLCTPECFDLYLHYVNAFCYWVTPPQLRDLGVVCSTPEAFVRSCRFYGHSHIARQPGFMLREAWVPPVGLAVIRHTISHLRQGMAPPPPPQEEIDSILKAQRTIDSYYVTEYPSIYTGLASLWTTLEKMEASYA